MDELTEATIGGQIMDMIFKRLDVDLMFSTSNNGNVGQLMVTPLLRDKGDPSRPPVYLTQRCVVISIPMPAVHLSQRY